MNDHRSIILISIIVLICLGCRVDPAPNVTSPTIEEEKAAILQTLNGETKAAFNREYERWSSYWVQDESISKVYLDYSTDHFSESIGWKEISGFVADFMEKNPEPEPVPQALNEIELKLFGDGAWVIYHQVDSLRGPKRETRLMQKINGQWKIAGMQTTIYPSIN